MKTWETKLKEITDKMKVYPWSGTVEYSFSNMHKYLLELEKRGAHNISIDDDGELIRMSVPKNIEKLMKFVEEDGEKYFRPHIILDKKDEVLILDLY